MIDSRKITAFNFPVADSRGTHIKQIKQNAREKEEEEKVEINETKMMNSRHLVT
jgi:hypothetical protein